MSAHEFRAWNDARMTDLVFTGGRFLTFDATHPDPDVVVVRDGRIAAVGPRAMVDAYPNAAAVDLAGRTLAPGFIDAHNHLSVAALHPRWRDLSQVTSLEELLAEVRAQDETEPDTEWVRCCEWNEVNTGVSPTIADLDALGLDRPIIVGDYTLHRCLVSSAGLDALGIGRTTPDPAGGTIIRGPDGNATGVLLERAWSEAHARSLAGYDDPDRWAELIAARARLLLASGITAVHDAACSPEAEVVYGRMRAAGQLPISVLVMPHSAALLMNGVGSRLDGPATGEGDEMLRVGPVKLFADGGYSIALDVTRDGVPMKVGTVMVDMAEHLATIVERGFRVGVHAMGNVGVQNAIDAFASASRARRDDDHRFRIEHAGVASKSQCAELAALGAIACVQPGFVNHVGEGVKTMMFDEHSWLPFRDLLEAGVTLAASSDDPCAPFPPMWTSGKGASRLTDEGTSFEPDQAVPVVEWLRAYSAGAAYAGGQEAERGTLTPGKRADLVVLDGPIEGEHPGTVHQTWIGGTLAFEAQGSGATG